MGMTLFQVVKSSRIADLAGRFQASQLGAVSPDFVVVTAAVVGLAVATLSEISDQIGNNADDVSASLEGVIDSTQFDNLGTLALSSSGGANGAAASAGAQQGTSSVDAILAARQAFLDARAAFKAAKAARADAIKARDAAKADYLAARDAYKAAAPQEKAAARAARDAAKAALSSARATLKARRQDAKSARAALKKKRKAYRDLVNG